WLLLRGAGVFILSWTIAHHVLPVIFKRIAHSSELIVLASVAWCFAGASALHLLGVPLEAAGLIIGLTLAGLPYSNEITVRLRVLRDMFLILLFLNLGAEFILPSGDAFKLSILLLTTL